MTEIAKQQVGAAFLKLQALVKSRHRRMNQVQFDRIARDELYLWIKSDLDPSPGFQA